MPGLPLSWLHIRGKCFDPFTSWVFNYKTGEIVRLNFAILVGAWHPCESFEDLNWRQIRPHYCGNLWDFIGARWWGSERLS